MKLFIIRCVAVAMVVLTACEPEADLFKTFVIPAGKHYSTTRHVQTLQSNVLSFDAKFNKSARYEFAEEGFQDSKNKLLGFSDCNSLHHENSARFAWQWFNNQLEVYAYCYVNGNRVEKFVGVVALDEVNHYEIALTGNQYVFYLNNEPPVTIERGSVCNMGMYYMLWPYFGGSKPAPHTVTIDIRMLP